MIASDFFAGNRFDHAKLARCLIDQFHCCWIEGQLHVFLDDGLYHGGPDAVHGAITSVLPELTDARRRETVRFLSVSYETPKRELAADRYIPFQNQVFDTLTENFLDYSPSLPFVYRIPHIYRRDAPRQESVDNFLMAVSNYDVDTFLLHCETLGRLLSGSTKYRGAFDYDGTGENGKSSLINFQIQLVGRENCSYLSMQDMTERFRLAELRGKLANFGDDTPGTVITDSSIFKKACTGEPLVAERKGMDPFSFRNRAALVFATNNLPPVSDRSNGMFSRLIIVPFTADFSKPENRDATLKDKQWSEAELEYGIALAMQGLRRLEAQGGFSRPKAVQEAVDAYRAENDPLEGFIEDFGDLAGQPVQAVYDEFVRWSHDAGHRNVLTRKRFTREATQKTKLIVKTGRHEYFGKSTGKVFARQTTERDVL